MEDTQKERWYIFSWSNDGSSMKSVGFCEFEYREEFVTNINMQFIEIFTIKYSEVWLQKFLIWNENEQRAELLKLLDRGQYMTSKN